MKNKLSPPTQKVLDAFLREWPDESLGQDIICLAAAIRALADQVAPSDVMEPRNNLPMAMENDRHRSEMLTIATELESIND